MVSVMPVSVLGLNGSTAGTCAPGLMLAVGAGVGRAPPPRACAEAAARTTAPAAAPEMRSRRFMSDMRRGYDGFTADTTDGAPTPPSGSARVRVLAHHHVRARDVGQHRERHWMDRGR